MAAFEQGEADLVLENADASTDCRLLQVQRNGSLTETGVSRRQRVHSADVAERLERSGVTVTDDTFDIVAAGFDAGVQLVQN
ncbi:MULTISPECIES: hypothetical protein [Rhizobium]|uniref:hypothetical protein n=1 Tax=Rhizobium TaxID=379 RepID=UPI0003F63A3B|nr:MULTISPECIES: hypothetical protein [Rhizobium]MCA0801721.1 hypothetical protein [Rhizobium sp. T1473]MCS0462188.1 hypothetical protein [Rhizobium favelukesii]UFS80895.1 hypothetical protein LPB79_21360 [Rhizobium sp. T136]